MTAGLPPETDGAALQAALDRLDRALAHLELALERERQRQDGLRRETVADLDGALRQLDGLLGEKQS